MNEPRHRISRSVIYVFGVLLVALLIHLFSSPSPTPRPAPAAPVSPVPLPAEADIAAAPTTPGTATPPAAAVAPSPAKPVVPPVSATVPEPVVEPEESWDFSPDELAREANETVTVRLESRRVKVGEEFEVNVVMSSPPLQAVVLAMTFDRAVVEPVPESGESVGAVFRKGVEFFNHPKDGRMALFCATRPGKKNVLSAKGETIARFRMRAVQAGRTVIGVDGKGVKFMGGSGRMLEYEFVAGEISVLP